MTAKKKAADGTPAKKPAGNSSVYKVGLLDQSGNPTGQTWDFPRVTSIIDDVLAKPRLLGWYYSKTVDGVSGLLDKYGDKVPHDSASIKSLLRTEGLSPFAQRDKSATKGTTIHAELEHLAKTGELATETPETLALLDWWTQRGLTPSDVLATERTLVSFTHRYAGTVDLVYRDPESGTITICDLKTGKYIHWSNFVQGEAYREAWLEERNPAVNRVSVLHVNTETREEPYWGELINPEVTFTDFRMILDIYRRLPVDWKPEEMEV